MPPARPLGEDEMKAHTTRFFDRTGLVHTVLPPYRFSIWSRDEEEEFRSVAAYPGRDCQWERCGSHLECILDQVRVPRDGKWLWLWDYRIRGDMEQLLKAADRATARYFAADLEERWHYGWVSYLGEQIEVRRHSDGAPIGLGD